MVNTMNDVFEHFKWRVRPAYVWFDWLDEDGNRLVIPTTGLMGLDSCTAVGITWRQLEEQRKLTGPVLGAPLDARPGVTYEPMSRTHAAMFRIFADLDYADPDAIQSFAATYGLLGLPKQEQILLLREPNRQHVASGESHLAWAREICEMREALRLSRSMPPEEEAEDLAAYRRHGSDPPYEEGRRKLYWLFNRHLQAVQPRMNFSAESPPELRFQPLTLLASMWLQLSLSLVGSKDYRSCKFCRRLFEISTELTGYRRHREFCSTSCKTKDYRRRRRLAVQLKAQGKSLSEISDAVKTEKATIRGWIAAARGTSKGKS